MKKTALVVLALCLCVAMFAGCTPAATTAAPTTAAPTTAAPSDATTAAPGETEALLGFNMVAAPEKGETFVMIADFTPDGMVFGVNTEGPYSSVVEGLDASGALVEKLSVTGGFIDLTEMAAKKIVKLKVTGPVETGAVVTELAVPATVADLK